MRYSGSRAMSGPDKKWGVAGLCIGAYFAYGTVTEAGGIGAASLATIIGNFIGGLGIAFVTKAIVEWVYGKIRSHKDSTNG